MCFYCYQLGLEPLKYLTVYPWLKETLCVKCLLITLKSIGTHFSVRLDFPDGLGMIICIVENLHFCKRLLIGFKDLRGSHILFTPLPLKVTDMTFLVWQGK